MDTPLNASATSAGTLISANTFVVPPYQREYAWESDEIKEFWDDLRSSLEQGSYFLGLIILTDDESAKHVVDGQQRILTIMLLAACLYHEALRAGRKALADRIHSDFLTSIDYQTDEIIPRLRLSDSRDDRALQALIEYGPDVSDGIAGADIERSDRLVSASRGLRDYLREDLAGDAFRRLGQWTDFLTNSVYLAVFVHPDPASAYRVFEVINTRGKELTTADLLKNYILSQTPAPSRDARYHEWQSMAQPLLQYGQTTLVQFIRHVVTLDAGHVLPRDLFAFLAGRDGSTRERRRPPSVPELTTALESQLPHYLQMLDATLDGPAEPEWLTIYAALLDLNVLAVRPLLMAIAGTPNATLGMEQVLRLVVRRIVVGNLGTGNVERRLSEAARRVRSTDTWDVALNDLKDLNPSRKEFVEQLRKRSYNKGTLTFMRRSTVQGSVTPEKTGFLHLVRPRQTSGWDGFPDDDFTYWGSTIGNTVLAQVERRPKGAATFDGFKLNMLSVLLEDEDSETFAIATRWGTEAVEVRGARLANAAGDIWFQGD